MKLYVRATSRITDQEDWFPIWQEDKEWIIDTMIQNIQDDLNAGYDPNGKSIKEQKADLENYKKEYHANLDMFKNMGDKDVSRWCFYDLKKRGAID